MADGERSMEARIEQLVELEQELTSSESAARGSGEATGDRIYADGTIAGATKIPVTDVPDDYPVPIDSERALRIDVETEGGVVETYLEWDVDGTGQGHVEQLLDVLDRDPGEFADVFGDRVALDYRDGYHGIDPEGTERLQSRSGSGGSLDLDLPVDLPYSGAVVAVLLAATAVTDQLFVLGGSSTTVALSGLLLVALPLAVAYDCRRTRERTEWDPLTLAWAVGAFVPFFNVPITTAYLLRRRAKLRSRPGTAPTEWRYAVGVAGLASLGVPVGMTLATPEPVVPLYAFVTVLLPLSVYFDFESADGDRTAARIGWTVGAAALSLVFAGFVAAGAYLYARSR